MLRKGKLTVSCRIHLRLSGTAFNVARDASAQLSCCDRTRGGMADCGTLSRGKHRMHVGGAKRL